jgi:hypothetical protein
MFQRLVGKLQKICMELDAIRSNVMFVLVESISILIFGHIVYVSVAEELQLVFVKDIPNFNGLCNLVILHYH